MPHSRCEADTVEYAIHSRKNLSNLEYQLFFSYTGSNLAVLNDINTKVHDRVLLLTIS